MGGAIATGRPAPPAAAGSLGMIKLPHWEEYPRGAWLATGIAAHFLRCNVAHRDVDHRASGVATGPGGCLAGGMSDTPAVLHNAADHRYEVTVDGHLSVCEYELAGERIIFTHTLVPAELRGRGIAEKLVRAALADVRTAGRQVVPACSYVAKFIERHKEFQDLLA